MLPAFPERNATLALLREHLDCKNAIAGNVPWELAAVFLSAAIPASIVDLSAATLRKSATAQPFLKEFRRPGITKVGRQFSIRPHTVPWYYVGRRILGKAPGGDGHPFGYWVKAFQARGSCGILARMGNKDRGKKETKKAPKPKPKPEPGHKREVFTPAPPK